MPLSHYSGAGGRHPNALLLGFGALRPELIRSEVPRLAAAIEAASRAGPPSASGSGAAHWRS